MLAVPPALNPLPEVNANYASTYLNYRKDFDGAQFYAGRTYSHLKKTQNMVFYITARGENAHKIPKYNGFQYCRFFYTSE